MIAYLDTSALLRLVLREPGALEELRSCDALVSSELVAVESLRTMLHLSTALVWRDRMRQPLVMATHDRDLALAARSFGLEVRGA